MMMNNPEFPIKSLEEDEYIDNLTTSFIKMLNYGNLSYGNFVDNKEDRRFRRNKRKAAARKAKKK